MNATIRQAVLPETDAIVECIDSAYAQYAETIRDLPAVSQGCDEQIRLNLVWVADVSNNVAGVIFLVPEAGFLKLANVAVHPDYRGKHLGRSLVEHAEHEARRRGYTEMRLNTHVAMKDNIRLYEHLGWKVVSISGNTVSMSKGIRQEPL